jgi:hypothetical protein
MQIVNIARQSGALQLFGRSTGSGPAAAHFTGTLCLKNIASVVPMNGRMIRAFGADDVARLRLVFRKLRFEMIADTFNITEAQTEAMIDPYGVADDFRRKTVSLVTGSGALPEMSLSVDCQVDKTVFQQAPRGQNILN